jgi:hypothetical protein
MKRFTMFVAIAAVLTSGTAFGEGPQLKPFRSMIGTWRYEGPCLEDLPGAEKVWGVGTSNSAPKAKRPPR